MKPLRPLSIITALASLSLVLASATAWSATLTDNSPFLPPGYGVEEAKPPPPPPEVNGPIAQQLEFRGLMKMHGQYSFSLFDKRNQKGYWLKESQAQDGIRVSNYDANSTTVVVTMNGRTERLTLMSASEAPLPVAASAPPQPAKNKPQAKKAPVPTANNSNNNNKRVIPRRRVILPKKK